MNNITRRGTIQTEHSADPFPAWLAEWQTGHAEVEAAEKEVAEAYNALPKHLRDCHPPKLISDIPGLGITPYATVDSIKEALKNIIATDGHEAGEIEILADTLRNRD